MYLYFLMSSLSLLLHASQEEKQKLTAPIYRDISEYCINTAPIVKCSSFNGVRGCGEIGIHARLRIWCFGVEVQVLSSAPLIIGKPSY